jgi:hypothetical protein
MRSELIALMLLAGCAAPAEPVAVPARAAFSAEALFASAQTYVANRYQRSELPSALISDLTAAGYECQNSAAGSRCTHMRQQSPTCFYADTVDIDTALNVRTHSDPRCMGVTPPASTP